MKTAVVLFNPPNQFGRLCGEIGSKPIGVGRRARLFSGWYRAIPYENIRKQDGEFIA